jgi:hypothetical protein
MGQNLTGQTIASTYEDLVQISGSILTDGLGADITSVSITASNAVSSSYALTASFALNVPTVNTGSLMLTGSATNNVLTFTKADGSTFNLTVATGSAVTVDTGSLLVTASIADATITFTKGDASTFGITVNNVQNASTASTAGTAGYAVTAGTAGFATSASFASQAGTAGYAATAGTSGFATSASFADQAGTAGYATTAGTTGFATSASLAQTAKTLNISNAVTADPFSILLGFASDNVTVLADSDLVYNPSTNILGNSNVQFVGTSSYALTASYVEGGVDPFPYTGSAQILGNVNVTVSGSSSAYLITSGSFTGSAVDNISNITASLQIKHVAYCTQAEYDAIIPDNNTLYFISGSGNDVEDLTVSGSLLVSGSTTFTGSIVGNVSALSISSNTASLDLNRGNFFTLQLVSGSNTYINPTNIKAGQTINLRVNTTGSATVSFPSSVKQVSGSAYVPTTTTGVDVVTFISFDTSSLYLSNVKNLV